jgi:citrate synthase
MSKVCKISIGEESYDLDVIEGSEQERAIDINKLRAKSGLITLDHGFANTGSCLSAVTFLNGEEGILQYRGYPIEQLSEKSSFLEVSYLLLYGEKPSSAQLDEFSSSVMSNAQLPDQLVEMISKMPKDSHPMGMLASSVVALGGYYPQLCSALLDDNQKKEIFPLLMGKFIAIAGATFQHISDGNFKVKPDQSIDYCSNFLNLMFNNSGDYKLDKDVAEALDLLFILHADHEQNCSASTVRIIGSSQANLFASISGGISALWGPLHGGANQAVIEMLESIKNDGGDHKRYLEKAKDKSDPFRLMGFGHRVYKNFDPRAKIIKKACDTVLDKLGIKDPVLDIAKGLEEEALKDPYFVERKLYPNVDFYSGIIYRALGIPTNMFTVMFAIGRLPGWLAQWKEMIESKDSRIGRPRQVFTGNTKRDY